MKKKKKEPDFLCHWDFCDSCINYRKKHKLPMPKLKPSPSKVSDNQTNNNKPWLWKKGQSGNLKGRPPGKTMKEYAREYLARLTDEERDEWLEGLPKEMVWKMGEGNPKQDTDITTAGKELPQPLLNINEILRDNSPKKDSKADEED